MTLRFGRYETMDRIAAGGMATVYLGRAIGEGGFERLVAIKVMHDHVAAESEFRDMFLDEARLAARIRHPNVVAVIDIQKAPEGLFLVMDYIDGPSLFQLRKKLAEKGEKIPLDVTLRIFVDSLSGLHAAHDLTGVDGAPLHLVHRDVSPQNILIGRDGITRITDFGVARAEARITSTRGGQLKGKIGYMPPEQIRNEDLDRRGDVYATGVALWEALVGRKLFDASSDAALVHMIITGAKQSPHDLDPTIPKEVSDVCMQALALRAEGRPESAAAFADALEEAAARAGTPVATSRRVASFLKGLPRSISARPPAGAVSSPSQPQPVSQPTSAPSGSRPDLPLAQHAPVAQPPPNPPEATTTRALVSESTDSAVSPKRAAPPFAMLIGAGALAAVLGGAGWYVLSGAASSAPAGQPSTAITASAPTTAIVASSSAASSPPESASAPTAAPSASASTSAAPKAAASAPPSTKGPTPRTGRSGPRAGVGAEFGEL